jgi:hypothetical protein
MDDESVGSGRNGDVSRARHYGTLPVDGHAVDMKVRRHVRGKATRCHDREQRKTERQASKLDCKP